MSGVIQRGTPGDVIGDTPSGITRNVIGATPSGIVGDGVEATPSGVTPPTTKEQIKGNLSALRSLVKEHNNRGNISPIHVNFNDVDDRASVQTVVTRKEVVDADLKKPFKEAVKTPLTRRIIEFAGPKFKILANVKLYDGTTDPKDHLSRFSSAANSEEWPMPVWCRMFQQTLNGSARGWFENHSIGSIDGWAELRQQFTTRFSIRRGGYGVDRQRNDGRNAFNNRDGLALYRLQILYQAPRGDHQATHHPRLTLNSLTKQPKEILASEPQLNLQLPRPMQLPPKKENQDKYCDYHEEKGHYTNDFFQQRKQLEMALESGKLNHLVKDVRQRGQETPREGMPKKIRTGLKTLRAVSSTIHSMVKFPTPRGIATLVTRTMIICKCSRLEKEQMVERELRALLKRNLDVLAWEPADMTGIPRRIIEHILNVNPSVEPIAQKRRVLASNRSQAVTKKVEEWVKAGIVRLVRYPTWISNLVLVKKGDRSWRMCIDFKNLNSPCPKDYYPLPDIDKKIKAVVGFCYKCFLDAYKEYRQMQMAQDDKEKTACYTNQGTYYYTKMPFGLKSTGATYQRLVDMAFQPQIGRNLEAYLDDMGRGRKVFGIHGHLRRDMGKPKKTKAIVDMQSPRTLREMKSLSGKLATLKRRGRESFQEIKKVMVELPLLTTPRREETLYVYLAAIGDAVSVVLLTERKEKQCPINYVSRTLNEAEMNYAPLEKVSSVNIAHVAKVAKPQRRGVNIRFPFELHKHKNEAEYETLLTGLRMAAKINVQVIDVKVDSKLVTSQINRDYVASSTSMITYLATADVLSKLATHAFDHLIKKVLVKVLAERSTDRKEVGAIVEEEEDNWMTPIV
ncbi:reverse transcriptase domain-containing protein [Tanacetum coccineum]